MTWWGGRIELGTRMADSVCRMRVYWFLKHGHC